ncbi:endonuclease domain-containing protein [uncultured Amnibacterium sp.]|uniref:endonuclease domain-containing protein n=1 Tax=uncultured Amnibacterium sp. TaxID=1631851 RepID=UPI0035CA26C5
MLPTDWSAVAARARAVLAANDGVAHLSTFVAVGLSPHQVAALFRCGVLIRPRIGWYADPALPFDAVRAIRKGGVLGGTSAAKSYALPIPEGAEIELQVSVLDNASRLRDSRNRTRHVAAGEEEGVRLHWQPRLEAVLGYRVAVVDALIQLALCVPFDWLVAAMDRALHVPRDGVALISGESWALLRPALPERLRHAWDLADGRSESPIETIVRLGLIRLGIAFDIQVWLLPYHRVDFLIGGWLIIEVDGKRYHVEDEQFEADRDRDALFAAWGFRVLRFSYRQVVEELDWVLDVISTVVSRGR